MDATNQHPEGLAAQEQNLPASTYDLVLLRYKEYEHSVKNFIAFFVQVQHDAKQEQQNKMLIHEHGKFINPAYYVKYHYKVENDTREVWYAWPVQNEKTIPEVLTEWIPDSLLAEANRNAPEFPSLFQGRTVPVVGYSGLFHYLSIYLGFYNFIPQYEDEKALGGEDATFCLGTFSALWEQRVLSEDIWRELRQLAIVRTRYRLIGNGLRRDGKENQISWHEHFYVKDYSSVRNSIYYTGDSDRFGYTGWYDYPGSCDFSDLVEHVVAGEEARLRQFLESLHGTLHFLKEVVLLKDRASVPTELQAMLQTLGLLKDDSEPVTSEEEASPLVEDNPTGKELTVTESNVSLVESDETEDLNERLQTDKIKVSFLDYLEAFYESLESALDEGERIGWSSIRNASQMPVIKKQYEGQYGYPCKDFFVAMGYLLKLLYETMRKGSESKQGAKLLVQSECAVMFEGIGIHAGFYNSFILNFKMPYTYWWSSPIDSCTCLIDFTHSWDEKDWKDFRKEAEKRICFAIKEMHRDSAGRYNFGRIVRDCHGSFTYHREFGSDEIKTVVSEVVLGETIRFRRFVEALHETLRFLADAAPLAHTKVKPPVFDWNNKKEAVDSFKNTIHLLRTVSTGGTVSLPQTQVFESSLAPTHSEELFTVELEDIGAVIALSKKEAALVVYAPAEYKRKKVKLTTSQGFVVAAYLVQQHIDGDIYAAIFPRLPLQDGVTETVVVECDTLKVGDDNTVNLFASNVTKVFLEE